MKTVLEIQSIHFEVKLTLVLKVKHGLISCFQKSISNYKQSGFLSGEKVPKSSSCINLVLQNECFTKNNK